jgi:integrase
MVDETLPRSPCLQRADERHTLVNALGRTSYTPQPKVPRGISKPRSVGARIPMPWAGFLLGARRQVPPGRLPNAEYRTREYLTEREVERLMKAAGNNRHGHRDATMILMAFRHGLRASELCSLRWEQADLVHGRLHVNRLKNGIPSVHPLTGIELRALRRLQREQKPGRLSS